MKVLGISGSPRSGGNTDILINIALEHIAEAGFETDFLPLAGRQIRPCEACGGCAKSDKAECALDDPGFEGVVERFMAADAVIVGSPVYFGSATPQTMALLDRVGYISRNNGNFLRRKVGAAVAVARRAGKNFTFAQLNYFFLISEMIVPGSTYWNVGVALNKGDIKEDQEGLETIRNLTSNMVWLVKKLAD